LATNAVRHIPRIRTAALAAAAGLAGTLAAAAPVSAQVGGRVQIADAAGQSAQDVGSAVVYIEGRGPRGQPVRADMTLDAREFRPRVVAVSVGSTVSFPNSDPFNHNVFSLSEPNDFDLGLYGRGERQSRRFRHPGLVRVYCNIHPRMSGFVMVLENAWFTQPGADGSFTIPDVPPGRYTLKVWHERASEVSQEITVPAGGLSGVVVAMDASGYRWQAHKNKYGEDYGTTHERY
jgi:plastocyanin